MFPLPNLLIRLPLSQLKFSEAAASAKCVCHCHSLCIDPDDDGERSRKLVDETNESCLGSANGDELDKSVQDDIDGGVEGSQSEVNGLDQGEEEDAVEQAALIDKNVENIGEDTNNLQCVRKAFSTLGAPLT